MLVNGWHANHIFSNWIITEMLFLEFASVGPMLAQADISTLAQRRTNGWITIGMFTGYLSQVAVSQLMTCAKMREMLEYDVSKNDRDGTTASNTFEEESLVIQGWKLFLKSLESEFDYCYCKINFFN